MKKTMVIMIILCILTIFLKYWISDYKISYDINGYKVNEVYKDKRFYIEISNDDKTYNFDIYKKRSLSKLKISKIDIIGDETFECVYPTIKGVKTYPLCYMNSEYIDYSLIDSELLKPYKNEYVNVSKPDKDFVYYNNLSDNEYVAMWNYNGYVVINGNSYENVKLFDSEKYDNSLSYMIDNKIYIADYDSDHEYNKLIILDVENLKYEEVDLGHNIDFDSYMVGNIENKLYIFDNKHAVLYEFNTKKNEIKVIANNEKGYVKYQDGKFVSCSKNEYKINKIKYDFKKSNYKYEVNNGLLKTYNENEKLNLKINNNNVNLIYEYEDDLYYLFEDNFYKYNHLDGEVKVFYNYELSYNSDNTIFVYVK